ncbi:Protein STRICTOSIDINE SYNTHASE-LIKE 4, partial [Sarracenia purpurea var. burkii]
GLLKVTKDGEIDLLTDEAEGVKFKLTDGVDVADNGVLYFTDASSKYRIKEFIWDALEGRPYGRFMSYDPSTQQTKVLVRDLYFANGVAISPDQSFVVFCETHL